MPKFDELSTIEDREHAIIHQIQFAIARGAPVGYLEIGTRSDALGFEFTVFGRVYKVLVIEAED